MSLDDLARARYESYCRRNGVPVADWERLSEEVTECDAAICYGNSHDSEGSRA